MVKKQITMNVIKKTTELWNAGHRIISVEMTEKKIEYQDKDTGQVKQLKA